MRRTGKVARRAFFNNAAGIHNQNAITKTADQIEIMADENQPHAALGHKIIQNGQNLHLHRDIKRAGWFIGNQQIGFRHQHHRNHDALAHAAGNLMRVKPHDAFRIADAHRFQHLQRLAPRLACGNPAMDACRFRNLLADCHDRIE